jgi:hypothetical protein
VAVDIRMRALPKSAVPAVPHPGICIIRKTHEYGQKLVNIGGLYSLLFPAKMSMTYTEGASTLVLPEKFAEVTTTGRPHLLNESRCLPLDA